MEPTTSSAASPLYFKVAPHIVEDLGLNLYTTLARVLVEFVANAHDADASACKVTLDAPAIDAARQSIARDLNQSRSTPDTPSGVEAAQRTLPDSLTIVIEDNGHGMSREELGSKFLFAGRRRRLESATPIARSPGGRVLMGRKGLGKLAGFGVGKHIEVISRKSGESHATRIVLNYDEIIAKQTTDNIQVPDSIIADGAGLEPSGTRITLSRLLYEPLKSRPSTIQHDLADHFSLIEPADFAITLNDNPIFAPEPIHSFAWPDPSRPADELVAHSISQEDGTSITFRYRLRFMGKNEALPAAKRGIRVYAHKRLAAAPSLLSADTNMHGFRMTDYLDGVVHADFIDEQRSDYIATDRQALRWESPLLSGMHEFLSMEIREACKQCQAQRDRDARREVQEDTFTIDQIAALNLGPKDRKLAFRFARILEGACKRGVADPVYRAKLPSLVKGLGHGNIVAAIAALAAADLPLLGNVALQIARLTRDELSQFMTTVHARLDGIHALQKIVQNVEFARANNEKQIQRLFEESPWLVNPTYTQFLSADERADTLFDRLARHLEIGTHAPADSAKRPDLVFLIGSRALSRLVIVELKSANTPLESDHLGQLELYIADAKAWLHESGFSGIAVEGHLIGTMPLPTAQGEGARLLRSRIQEAGPSTAWQVRDYLTVLTDAEAAHQELLDAYEQRGATAEDADEDDSSDRSPD